MYVKIHIFVRDVFILNKILIRQHETFKTIKQTLEEYNNVTLKTNTAPNLHWQYLCKRIVLERNQSFSFVLCVFN